MNNPIDKDKIETAVTMILEAIGEDVTREGIINTPRRVAKMYEEIFSGIHMSPQAELQISFTEYHDELVLVKDIPLYSMCEHHLLPFYGKAHLAYIPRDGKVVGISKLARVIDVISRRPQLQERLTSQIADCIKEALLPHGVAVVIKAEHMCMTMRGVHKPGTIIITSAVRGIFASRAETRAEVLSLINNP